MKKITIYEAWMSGGISELMENKMRALDALEVIKLKDYLEKEIKPIEELRLKLVDDIVGKMGADGKRENESPETIKKLEEEFLSVLETEVEDTFSPIKIGGENIEISPRSMDKIKDFIIIT